MPSNRLILCQALLLLPSIFPSLKVLNYSAPHIRWPKYWSFSFSINPSNEYSVLISFRIDWFDLITVQGTLKSLLQHHSSKASILWCSAFFRVQLSQPYITTGKSIASTIWTFVGKVLPLLFNTLSRYWILENTGVGSHSLLQEIFPTQGLNLGLPHFKWILYHLSHRGSPRMLEWVAYPFSSRSSWPRNWTRVSYIVGGFFTSWATREAWSWPRSHILVWLDLQFYIHEAIQHVPSMSDFFHSTLFMRFIHIVAYSNDFHCCEEFHCLNGVYLFFFDGQLGCN